VAERGRRTVEDALFASCRAQGTRNRHTRLFQICSYRPLKHFFKQQEHFKTAGLWSLRVLLSPGPGARDTGRETGASAKLVEAAWTPPPPPSPPALRPLHSGWQR
jgi:hypothetical protein